MGFHGMNAPQNEAVASLMILMSTKQKKYKRALDVDIVESGEYRDK
jgi:hypothetical protein